MRVEVLSDQNRQPVGGPARLANGYAPGAGEKSAGVWGEDALTLILAALPDEWVLLRGYRNRRGETDHLLVGPGGLWAVEVKRRHIRLHADGNDWWYERLDPRGRVIETAWAVERGRSWAEQVNQVATALDDWLRRNGCQVPVRTAVLVLHEHAQVARCANLTVNLVGSHPRHLLQALVNEPRSLNAGACEEIVKLIRRDHRQHQNRRHAR